MTRAEAQTEARKRWGLGATAHGPLKSGARFQVFGPDWRLADTIGPRVVWFGDSFEAALSDAERRDGQS
jgi:hypothetical protein